MVYKPFEKRNNPHRRRSLSTIRRREEKSKECLELRPTLELEYCLPHTTGSREEVV